MQELKAYEMFEKLLKRDGLRAQDVANATGISTSNLSDWKSGRSHPKLPAMLKIANFFGVSIQYLLTGEESEPTRRMSMAAAKIAEAADARIEYKQMCQATMDLSDEQLAGIIRLAKLLKRE